MNTILPMDPPPVNVDTADTYSSPRALRRTPARLRHRLPHTMAVDATSVEEFWVLNTAVAKQIEAHAVLLNTGTRAASGHLHLKVVDPRDHSVLTSASIAISVAAGQRISVARMLQTAKADVWSFDTQNLYQIALRWKTNQQAQPPQTRALDFAFFQFATEGVGSDDMFRLRNRKSRLNAVIPWSCWATTGLVPVVNAPEKALNTCGK